MVVHTWTDRHSAYGTNELCNNKGYYFVPKSNNFKRPCSEVFAWAQQLYFCNDNTYFKKIINIKHETFVLFYE